MQPLLIDVDPVQMREDIRRLSLGRNDLTVTLPYMFTEDHLWLRPNGEGKFHCGVTSYWYITKGSAYQLFDPLQFPHWLVDYPVGETLMDARDYHIYCSKLDETKDEWYKPTRLILQEMVERPVRIYL